MKYLINVVETYRVDTEAEADQLIEEAKAVGNLSKYSCVYKEKKQKGEVIEDWYRVTLTKTLGDEKDTDSCSHITIKYE